MVDINATKQIINTLGLTDNEFAVYSAFLKYGESSAAVLGRIIKMDKSSAYRATENLEKLGLITKNFKKRGTTYQAAPPDVLRELYSSKRSQVDMLIEDLRRQDTLNQRTTYMTIEKGIAALRHRMSESLESKEKFIREKFNDKFRFFDDPEHVKFVLRYAKERANRNIKIIQLEESNWVPSQKRFGDLMTNTEKYVKEVRRLPNDMDFGDNSIRIWDNTLNIVSEDGTGDFIVITIKDKFVVRLLKDMYDFIWNRCSQI